VKDISVLEATAERLARLLTARSPCSVLRGHRGSVLTLFAFAEPNLLLSGGRDNLIRCWVRSANRAAGCGRRHGARRVCSTFMSACTVRRAVTLAMRRIWRPLSAAAR